MKNVLILSIGRRVELAQAFRAEIYSRHLSSKIIATDFQPNLSSACQVVDVAIKSPKVTDPEYLDFLLNTCIVEKIGLVIPTIDTELLLLSENRDRFEKLGVYIAISSNSFIARCRDKRLTASLFDDLNINTPKIYNLDCIEFPCFVKPYDGSCSVGALAIYDSAMLTDAILSDEKMMFMELIDKSHKEYTVDAYFDKNSKLICIVPRERIEVRGGEISKGATRLGPVYDYLLPKLNNLNGVRGCITLQLFFNEERKRFLAFEINPRFGGGFPLSYCAGANYPGWLIDEYLLDKKIEFFDKWEANLLMLRFDSKFLIHDFH